jgi:hypothetical protein
MYDFFVKYMYIFKILTDLCKRKGKEQLFFRGLFNSHDFKILKGVFGDQKNTGHNSMY